MEYTIKKHAMDSMRERKIELTEALEAVKKGEKWFSKTDGRWHAKMRGIEVVFERNENSIKVITCFYEG